MLIPGILLLTGCWGMLVQELALDTQYLLLLLPAIAALVMGLMLRWDRKWQTFASIGLLVLTCVGLAILHKSLSSGLAALLERIGKWWFLRTGNYAPGYEAAGYITAILLLLAVCTGFVTAWFLRMKRPIAQLLITLVALAAWMAGLFDSGWWLAASLLGTMLVLASYASGHGKTLTFSGVVTLVVAAAFTGTMLFSGFAPAETGLGSRLRKTLHNLRWEEAENPLPEGVLTDLGAYRPTDDKALEVTMQHWTPLYLRGFVAGNYTDTGWEALDTAQLAGDADVLYTLQEEHFYGADQLAKAWQSVETSSDNAVSIRVLGACRSTAYLPYGAGTVTDGALSSADLLWEGMRTPKTTAYSAQLYPVESSYLLQEQLKDTNTTYRSAESIYRDWVYKQYLTVPESSYEVLTKHFSIEKDMTTVQAKREIAQLLPELIGYNENILTSTGQRDFLSYVMEVSREGYSVHYATLATLLLRCCGIPARYVEGYVVSPSQAEALADGETLTLTQSNAHAWTEYYLDGVGWVPFDATPGYENIIVYELPTDGLPTQESGGGIQYQEQEQQSDPPKNTPNVEEEKTKESQHIYVREAVSIVLIILLLTFLLLLLRTALLRHRLRKRQRTFHSDDRRKACAGILCYIQALTKITGSLSVSDIAEQTAAALDQKVSAADMEALLNEVWYSAHTITKAQQETALSWLNIAIAVWKQKTPPIKRFGQRFITCKLL